MFTDLVSLFTRPPRPPQAHWRRRRWPKPRAVLIGLALLTAPGCSSLSGIPNSPGNAAPVTSLAAPAWLVSPAHRESFAFLHRHSAVSLPEVFAALNVASDPYCTELLRGRALESSARALFTAERAAEFIAGRHPDSLLSLIAGCRNFFEMNDLRPDRDFAAIRALYPEARFECYSVGLLQPYIMHSVLGCDELSMLDINWRILELHAHILKAADSRALGTSAAVRESLAKFYLKFPAMGGNRLNAPLPAAIERLCRPLQHDYCRTVLPAFQQKLAVHAPQFVQLQLSSLHEGSYRTPRENRLRVIFLSNAIEESYTSADEFRKFLRNLRESARAPLQPDLLIHHVGGWKLFGIYALYHEPTTEEPRIATLCKDSYLSMSRGAGETPVEYLTHFERQETKANLSRRPSCAALANRGHSKHSQ